MGDGILRRVVRVIVGLTGLLVLAVAGGVLLLSQTVTGRQMAGGLARDALQGAVRGQVRLGPVTGGNLLTSATLGRLEISGPDGEPFLALRGVTARYNPLDLLRGRYVFREVELERGEIRLSLGDDGTWNYERIFDAGGDDDGGAGPRVALYDVRLADGRLAVRLPMDPPAPGETQVWNTDRDGDGRLRRALDVDSLAGRFPRLMITDPREPTTIELEAGRGVARMVRQPLTLEEVALRAVFRDTVDVEVERLTTAASSLSGEGWVVGDEPLAYRFDLRADPLSFVDLRWLPVPVPSSGGGPMDLVLRSSGEDMVVQAEGARVVTGGSEMDGGFSLLVSERPRFDTLSVRFSPLRLSSVRELATGPVPMDGTITGTVDGRGPLDGFRTDADLRFRGPGEGGAGSGLRARGTLGLTAPWRMEELELSLEAFDPGWTRLLGYGSRLEGRLGGTLTLSGRPDSALSFRADLTQRLADGSSSRVSGSGGLETADPPRMEAVFELRPLALAALQPYFPNLEPVGSVRGQVRVSGSAGDLSAEADLITPRGELEFDGLFDLAADLRTYDARLTARGIQLQEWFDGGPVTELAVRGTLNGIGTDPATLRARADLRVLPSVVEGARVDSSLLRFRFSEGLATVDTFAIESDVGRIQGSGALGLEEGRTGALVLVADAPDLSSWNRWVLPGRNPARPDTTLDELFQDMDREAGAGVEEPVPDEAPAPPDTLRGRLSVRGVAFGNVRDLSVGGQAHGGDVSYGDWTADSLVVTVDAVRPGRLDSLGARAVGWRVGTPVTTLDSAFAEVSRGGGAGDAFQVHGRRDTTLSLDAHGLLAWGDDRRSVRLDGFGLKLGARSLALEAPATVTYADSGLFVDTLRLRDDRGSALRAGGRIPDRGAADFSLRVEELPLENFGILLPPEDSVGGLLTGGIGVTGTASDPEITADLLVREPEFRSLAYGELTGRMEYRDREASVSVDLAGQEGAALATVRGTVAGDLSFRSVERRFPEEPVDVTVRSSGLPMGWLGGFVGGLREVRGAAEGTVRVRGGPGRFRLEGSASLADGSALAPSLGIRLEGMIAQLRFRDSVAVVDSASFRSSAGGRGSVSGRLSLATVSDPGFDLQLRARELRAMDRRKASVVVDGSGRLTGRYRAPELTGEFRVSDGDIQMEPYLREREMVDLTDPRSLALIDTTVVAERRLVRRLQNPFLQNMAMTVQLQVGPDLWLRSRDLDVEVTGDLRVRMRPAEQTLALFGSLRLLRGTYRYGLGPYSRELQIEDGTIEFVGTPGVNPNLDVTALYRTRAAGGRVAIRANVGGTLLDKRLQLTSDPPLSESDQLCYLLVGTSCVGATRPGQEGGGLARQVPRQLLGTVGTQLSSLLVEDAWFDYLNVSTASLGTEGTGGDFPASGSLLAGTQFEAGKYLGRNFFVVVSQTLGSRLPGASVEWTFTDDWTLEARTENRFGRLGAISFGSALEVDRTWGLFLFREWRW